MKFGMRNLVLRGALRLVLQARQNAQLKGFDSWIWEKGYGILRIPRRLL